MRLPFECLVLWRDAEMVFQAENLTGRFIRLKELLHPQDEILRAVATCQTQ